MDLWPILASISHVAAASAVTIDAVLHKRYVQAIIGWVGLAWLAPFFGAAAYVAFGINGIRRIENNLECHDVELAERLQAIVDHRLRHARQLELASLEQRWPLRLRNGLARLLSPCL